MIAFGVRADAIPGKNQKNAAPNRILGSVGAMRTEPEIRRPVQADRSIQTAEPWETMSNPGIQTSLAWVAKMALIAKCRRLAKSGPGRKSTGPIRAAVLQQGVAARRKKEPASAGSDRLSCSMTGRARHGAPFNRLYHQEIVVG
jgi:hypothetical protein